MKICLGGISPPAPRPCAVTIGNFDGVHTGHQHILQRLRDEADVRGLQTAAVVFEPQPNEFFAATRQLPPVARLSPLRDKLRLLAQTGCLDTVWVLRFNEAFAHLSADEFIRRILRHSLDTRYLLIGDDFRFGAGRKGDFALLQAQNSFETEQTPSILTVGERASSTGIRRALAEGRLNDARRILGHDYILSGRVTYGKQLGHTLGIPTANIWLPPHCYALNGIFIVEAEGAFGRRRGAASFGLNPTTDTDKRQKLEVHLLDYNGDLYGQRLHIRFLHKLRDEQHFDSLEALLAQIHKDIVLARSWPHATA